MLTRESILQQALALPLKDQVFVVHALEDHLISHLPAQTSEAEGTSDDELLEELHRRSAAYRTGKSNARSATEAMADLRQRQEDENRT